MSQIYHELILPDGVYYLPITATTNNGPGAIALGDLISSDDFQNLTTTSSNQVTRSSDELGTALNILTGIPLTFPPEPSPSERFFMVKKRVTSEQIILKLREIEVLPGQGESLVSSCRKAEVSEQTVLPLAA